MRLSQLQEILKLCPSDTRARAELAGIFEARGEVEAALASWKEVLVHDPNNLQAWEGVARCRRQAIAGKEQAG